MLTVCIGYSCWFPFLADEEAYRPVSRNSMNLYELMFSPDVEPATLAVIGCIDTTGSVAVAAEMQCRYATRVFKVSSLLFYRTHPKFLFILEITTRRHLVDTMHKTCA